MNKALYIYPWDAADPGQPLAPWRDAGFSELSLAVSYHAGKFITPNHSQHRVVFPEDGTVYLPKSLGQYNHIVAKTAQVTLTQPDLINTLKQDFDVSGWTVVNHNSRLGSEYPEATVKNAFGDGYVYALCPANPDVRDYGLNLCQHVSRAGIKHLKLESPGFLPYEHGYHHEFGQVNSNRYLDTLLGLCFCDHCIEQSHAAGVNTPVVQKRVRELIDSHLQHNHLLNDALASQWLMNLLITDHDFNNFIQWRCELVSLFLRDVKASLPADHQLTLITSIQQPQATAVFEGIDFHRLANCVDRIEIPAYLADFDAMLADIVQVQNALKHAGRDDMVSVILRPALPDSGSQSEFQAKVDALTRIGIKQFSFYNFGLLPKAGQQWLLSL
jgi:hypothetical protein